MKLDYFFIFSDENAIINKKVLCAAISLEIRVEYESVGERLTSVERFSVWSDEEEIPKSRAVWICG